METTFNFKSAICTDRNQSERLLALGLKKETADMVWVEARYGDDEYLLRPLRPNCFTDIPQIPAWSLGRLLEVMRMKASAQVVPLDDTFDRLIEGLETRIKEGHFNKEYLV